MAKQIQLSIHQRAEGLKDLIQDGKERGFNKDLIKNYEAQLFKVQQQIQKDKDKKIKFKLNIVERGKS